MFTFTKEMAERLKKIREDSGLSQKEVGIRMGIKPSLAQSVIAQLEAGRIKNPTLKTILDYLSVCNYPWSRFFTELSAIAFKLQEDKLMATANITQYSEKISRDLARYRIGLEHKYPARKKLREPLSPQKREVMAQGFLSYRAEMEKIERAINRLLGDTSEPTIVNRYYMAFARECYRRFKKYGAGPEAEAKISERLSVWQDRGLKKELLEKIKELVKEIRLQA